MAIFYNKVERGNPADPAAPKKWYPALKSLDLVREEEVGKQLAEETTHNLELIIRNINDFIWILSLPSLFFSEFCPKLKLYNSDIQ